ncbi:hypothetical protein S40285_01539 [Stachybotrys chlorohalonatus IBT 40285]|uniref:Cyclin N-terminal domain-containing protein n=1 Tax=Stachybotrys chlorohalonatus (strain IBT 40285) TaxID=1283841 RepID=A0A084QMP0_STAC4|nr:hypothetical protein S40285_01539 [Stachybotrys chlorohalonata IBT 40285]
MSHLTNPLATASQLHAYANFSSLPLDLQEAVFIATQCLTQAAGVLLEIPQSITAKANVILARYWLVDPPMANEFSDVSAACLYLASKLSAEPQTSRDIANVYAYLTSSDSAFLRPGHASVDQPLSYYQDEFVYLSFCNRLFDLEARISYALSYDMRVALPHPLAITYLRALDFLLQPEKEISVRTVQYLNTALLSPQMLYLTHQPHALATAAIYNAAKDLGAKMPDCAWWEVFDVDREQLGFLVVGMRSLEGWFRKRKEEAPALTDGMVTRQAVEAELAKRGLRHQNGDEGMDEEAELMRRMDEKAASG